MFGAVLLTLAPAHGSLQAGTWTFHFYGLVNELVGLPGDADGDGFSDGFEATRGFNPNAAASTPESQLSIRTAIEFRFNAAAGVSYRIEGSADLAEWTTVEAAVNGAGGVVTRFYSTENTPIRFYRVVRN